MKKSTNKLSQRPKLALHPETIASLTPTQLSHVAGGVPNGSALRGCIIEP